jgi:hypothetical protein
LEICSSAVNLQLLSFLFNYFNVYLNFGELAEIVY